MNNLFETIELSIKNAIEEYTVLISKKYKIDIDELNNIWNSISTRKIEISKNIKTTEPKNSKEKNEEVLCPYIYTKGENKGDKCGSKPKNNGEYCSKHQKYEGIGQKEKKNTPKSVSSASSVSSKKGKSPPKKSIEKILRLNTSIDKWWNAETELVFKSRDERYVIGSYRDGKINELTEDDIMLCDQYGFKYIEKVVDNVKEHIKEEKKDNKKSILSEIDKTNIYAKDIENVLHELQVVNGSLDSDDEDEEEYIEEDELLEEDY